MAAELPAGQEACGAEDAAGASVAAGLGEPGEQGAHGAAGGMNPAAPAEGDAPVDLVCPWVDGSDPAWRAERAKYAEPDLRSGADMYRDWGLMRYWFRGVELALPWVRTVHFLTWGHVPEWLDTGNPRLHVVRHEEFIPHEFLPTFSSNVIGLNAHRVCGLAERFIWANDDMLFLAPLRREEYFQGGLPCDCLHAQPITEQCSDAFGYILWNNISCLNRHFSLQDCMRAHPEAWFSERYPQQVLDDNRRAAALRSFPGLANPHTPLPMLRGAYEQVWGLEGKLLRNSCRQRFRTWSDLSEWLMRYWQMASGEFVPYARKGEVLASAGSSRELLKRAALSPESRVACVNDAERVSVERVRPYLQRLLERALPRKSSFELW